MGIFSSIKDAIFGPMRSRIGVDEDFREELRLMAA